MTDSIRDWFACVAVAILASGTGAMVVFVHRLIRNHEYIAFRAGQLHGARIAIDEIKAAIDRGVDIESLRRELDNEERVIAELANRTNA